MAACEDVHSRRVIGWAVSDRMKRNPAIQLLGHIITHHCRPVAASFTSNRGSHPFSLTCQKTLPLHGLLSLDEQQGQCYDLSLVCASGSNDPMDHIKVQNAPAEVFQDNLAELFWRRTCEIRPEAKPPQVDTSAASRIKPPAFSVRRKKPLGFRPTPANARSGTNKWQVQWRADAAWKACLERTVRCDTSRCWCHVQGMDQPRRHKELPAGIAV